MPSSLLLDESPLLVLPTLAKVIGLNEAVVLQQLHFWIEHYRRAGDKRHFRLGRWWIYNSIKAWHKEFPWWSPNTIRRALTDLISHQLVTTRQFQNWSGDHTTWYTISYAELDKLLPLRSTQDEQIDQPTLEQAAPEWANHDQDQRSPEITSDPLWSKVLPELEGQTTRATFDTWLRGTTASRTGNTLTVHCRHQYQVDWLTHRLNRMIARTVQDITAEPDLTLEYTCSLPSPPPSE